ncbi:nuclear envelope integral membrane protein 1-like isoform X1 [Colius striatus]|uniref:nuclear envelope integral membrane protein 1-like isoform X1 n=1 Tax=Colius striatus TaxID=57412 RepID=UPI002B1E7289|nr:nuclear envelope integral membrane protein 1-like isoform X1 [Colius striatus]
MLLLSHRLPAVCELGDLPHGLHVRPTGNERSIHLIWGLQLLGLPLLYAANQIHPLALAVMLIPICIKIINYIMYWASAAQRRGRSIWAQPSPCHLLTQEEYQMQGEVETRRAVKELRKYCQSPEINVQAIRRRLRSPERQQSWEKTQTSIMPAPGTQGGAFQGWDQAVSALPLWQTRLPHTPHLLGPPLPICKARRDSTATSAFQKQKCRTPLCTGPGNVTSLESGGVSL